MEKGALRRVFDYYADQAWFGTELDRLVPQFFDVPDKQAVQGITISDIEEGLLNEWLLFDAILSNGKTMLEDFNDRNPYHWSPERMAFYSNIVKTNRYSFFEAITVNPGEGLSFRDLSTNESYEVRERAATFTLKPGYLFHGRVAKVGDHWELVGADSSYYPTQLTQRYREFFHDPKAHLTPKETYRLFAKRSLEEEIVFPPPFIDPKAAQTRLERFLKQHGLLKHVSVEDILRWIRISDDLDVAFETNSLLYGLTDGKLKKRAVDELIASVSDVCNTTPRDVLGGKSPQQKASENPNRQPEFISDLRSLGGEIWIDKLNEAVALMQAGRYVETVAKYREMFAALLEEKTTRSDIYRIFANKAVAHFAAGQTEEGKYMVALALAMNPNYDFAQRLCERHDPQFSYGAGTRKPTKRMASDPAARYFLYLKERGISFATDKLTTSHLTTFNILRLPVKRRSSKREQHTDRNNG